jgi:tetratricopeptide (TPR) repeat protein
MANPIVISAKQIIAFLLGGVILGGAFAIMGLVADVRVQELKFSLRNMSPERAAGSSLSLISRFILLKDRATMALEAAKDTQAESELMTITSAGFIDLESNHSISWPQRQMIGILNMFYRISGSNPIIDFDEEKLQKILEVAFVYERTRNFTKAIEVYKAALKNYKSNTDMVAYIYLHTGFCKAMEGLKREAIRDLEKSKLYDPYGEIGYTADILSAFIIEMQSRLATVKEMMNSLDKAEMLYRITAYKEAINTLNKLDQKKNQRFLYLRGRSSEEIGYNGIAIADYRSLIAMNSKSDWALKANRRLYMLGTFYENNKAVSKEATETAKKQNDQAFIKSAKKYREIIDADNQSAVERNEVLMRIEKDIQENIQKDSLPVTSSDSSIDDISAEVEPLVPPPVLKKNVTKVKPRIKPMFIKFIPPPHWASKGTVSKKQSKALQKDINKLLRKNKAAYIRQVLRSPETSREKRKKILLSRFPKLDKVTTKDGNIYYGIIPNQNPLETEILTVAGPIKIPNDAISGKEKTKTEKSFLESEVGQKEGQLFTTLSRKLRIKLLNPKLSQGTRKELIIKNFNQIDSVLTEDGNILYGLVFSVDPNKTRLITVAGMINIPNSIILEWKKVPPNEAFGEIKSSSNQTTDKAPNIQDSEKNKVENKSPNQGSID